MTVDRRAGYNAEQERMLASVNSLFAGYGSSRCGLLTSRRRIPGYKRVTLAQRC